MMISFLVIVSLVLVLANAWNYGIARDAIDQAEILRMRMEGMKQRLDELGYRVHLLEQKKEKKK